MWWYWLGTLRWQRAWDNAAFINEDRWEEGGSRAGMHLSMGEEGLPAKKPQLSPHRAPQRFTLAPSPSQISISLISQEYTESGFCQPGLGRKYPESPQAQQSQWESQVLCNSAIFWQVWA